MEPNPLDAQYLDVVGPPAMRGRRVTISRDHLVIGRGHRAHVQLDEPHVSRTHAAIERQGGDVYVKDLGSSGGTTVNGVAISGERRLEPGDVLRLAAVEMVYHAPGLDADRTVIAPPATGDPSTQPDVSEPRYSIGDQSGQVISNVGRDQYNAYIRQRDSFMRDVASTKTKARWLVWIGLLLFVAGFAVFASGVLGFIDSVSDSIGSGNPPAPDDPFGAEIYGMPAGLIGWAVALIGVLLLIIGIVLHVVATSRRKRVEREWPLHPPWQSNG